ncbi:MAG: hypothetical protein H7210_07720 [Pyrinomonadaceae bacterium]|nr:hypothetical protein [Phycisphaerales bacterium]
MTLAAFHIGPIQFEQPVWLLLIPLLGALTVWLARSSLSGLGTVSRRAALVIRLLVITLLAAAIAHPQWRREAKDVAVIAIVDQSESIPVDLRARIEQYLRETAKTAKKGDRMGQITVARDAYVQSLPGLPGDRPDSQNIGATDGTNLSEGTNLGLAVIPEDAAGRILLISDFNQTAGDLMNAAQAARAANIKIDVLPIRYRYQREVMMDRLVSPATGRMGENVNLRVILSATRETTGTLDVRVNGRAVDLDPESAATGAPVTLKEGANAIPIPITLAAAGAQRFEAVFTPDEPGSDTLVQNNRQNAVTFVTGQGKVLVIAPSEDECADFITAMTQSRIQTEVRLPAAAPQNLIDLTSYDALVLVNVAAYEFNQGQQEMFRAYVHDLGGGLLVTGGEDAFGAGGWIGSPTADAMPLKLEVPDKRKMPRGALAIIVHSCEIPQGNFWGKKVSQAAVDALSGRDMAGVIEFGGMSGKEYWLHPLSELGNKSAIRRSINSLTFGDAPSFAGFLQVCIGPMKQAQAGQKHVIIISDGDPSPPPQSLIQQFIDAKITISTVCVFPHMGSPDMMKNIAIATGGKDYLFSDQNQLAELPKIFMKEAQKVKRNLIWEGDAVAPRIVAGGTEPMRGISTAPPVSGYVVTTEREDRLAQIVMSVKTTDEDVDPLLAQGQYGLGKSVAFTSDIRNKWGSAWLGWAQYRQFWEQHVRWVMRPSTSAELRVSTESQGERTRVVVEAFDPDGDYLSFLRWRGAVVGPDGKSSELGLRQFAPGQYEAFVDSSRSGSYMMNFRYDAPADEAGKSREGSVQAAITKPYADEYRQLQDNVALARQVAELTGGRVVNEDPRIADLWSRDGLAMPVATRPIWLTVAIIAISMFLMDVGVHRVRIDILGMFRTLRRGASKAKSRGTQQMGSLREARDRAKEELEARGKTIESAATSAAARAAAPAVSKEVRTAKFEASEEELKTAKRAPGPVTVDPFSDAPLTTPKPQEEKKKPVSPEEGMSRLLKAKRRAQDDMTKDDQP